MFGTQHKYPLSLTTAQRHPVGNTQKKTHRLFACLLRPRSTHKDNTVKLYMKLMHEIKDGDCVPRDKNNVAFSELDVFLEDLTLQLHAHGKITIIHHITRLKEYIYIFLLFGQ